jgi:hypothetical protein
MYLALFSSIYLALFDIPGASRDRCYTWRSDASSARSLPRGTQFLLFLPVPKYKSTNTDAELAGALIQRLRRALPASARSLPRAALSLLALLVQKDKY